MTQTIAVCPECGLPGVPILRGYPNERGNALVAAGLAVLGGCVVGPDMDDYACPRRHQWRGPGGVPEGQEIAGCRLYAEGDLTGAERAFRAALNDSIGQRGERDRETRALRHALAIVLAAAGRADEAESVYAPLRPSLEEIRARIEERYRRAGLQ